MTDTTRYYSLLARQEDKLNYAPDVRRAFETAVIELGPNPSRTGLARWLTERGTKPSANSKRTVKWTTQTVTDWLMFDGIEPTDANIRAFEEGLTHCNKSARNKLIRNVGFRVSAMSTWRRVEETVRWLRGDERHAFDEKQLMLHLTRIAETAASLRAALRIPYY
ncbi:hypothetical protein [Pseudopontixanthobacter vadosimaris]|uniref:hypothetical protein n=1 Tax=Pseudopontixanthobacter vadosimaris TaxID=2726450 RepID=UPI00147297F3|nr:hypothetical protein [Pseudopontixanthobacter vadosimaris]